MTRGSGRVEEGGGGDEGARDASDVWRDQTCFSISTALFFPSLEVLFFGRLQPRMFLKVSLTLLYKYS